MRKLFIFVLALLILFLLGCSKKVTVVKVAPIDYNVRYDSPSQENVDGSDKHLQQAKRFYANGKYKQARKHCEKAIALNHRNWGAHYYLGLAMQKKREYTVSIEALGVSLKYSPDNKYVKSEIHFAIGLNWEKLGNSKRAFEEYKHALAFNPGNDSARRARNRLKVNKTMENWGKDVETNFDG